MSLFCIADGCSRARMFPVVTSRFTHALGWTDGRTVPGTTRGGNDHRAIGSTQVEFVRDGDLNRVDIAALSRNSLVAGAELGKLAHRALPIYPRSTRSVQANLLVPPASCRAEDNTMAVAFSSPAHDDQGLQK